MKNIFLYFLLFSQVALNAQTIEPAPADKAVVYFVRANSVGIIMDFVYFDNDQAIARFNGMKYFRYECEPGEHLFWAKAESRDYVRADLEAGKIYFIDVIPQMGIMSAGVKLVPINSSEYNMRRIKKLLTKKESVVMDQEKLAALQKRLSGTIEKGLLKLEKNENKVERLSGYSFSPENF